MQEPEPAAIVEGPEGLTHRYVEVLIRRLAGATFDAHNRDFWRDVMDRIERILGLRGLAGADFLIDQLRHLIGLMREVLREEDHDGGKAEEGCDGGGEGLGADGRG